MFGVRDDSITADLCFVKLSLGYGLVYFAVVVLVYLDSVCSCTYLITMLRFVWFAWLLFTICDVACDYFDCGF